MEHIDSLLSRQVELTGSHGQQRILSSSVFVAGLGGVGAEIGIVFVDVSCLYH